MIPNSVLDAWGAWVYLLIFAIAAGETSAFLGLLVPGETLVIAAGVLASRGHLDIVGLILATIAGAIVGDTLGYTLGHRQDARTRKKMPWGNRRTGPRDARMERARAFLIRRGGLAVFAGRFVGFARPLVPFAAGAIGMSYRRFVSYAAPAAITWAIGSALAGFFLGSSAEGILHIAGVGAAAALSVAALLLVVIARARRHRQRGTHAAVRRSAAEAGPDPAGERRGRGWPPRQRSAADRACGRRGRA